MVVRLRLSDLDGASNQQALVAEVIARMEKQGPEMGHGKVTTTWAEGNTSFNVSVEVGDSEADAACKRVLLSLAWA